MDFNDTAEESAFREQARSWLTDNVPTRSELEGMDYMEKSKLWQKRKYDAGMACIRWPKQYGNIVCSRAATSIGICCSYCVSSNT